MSEHRTKPAENADVFAIEKFVADYEHALVKGETVNLSELVGEVPSELRDAVTKKLLVTEIRVFQTNGWTYNKDARIQDFPQYRAFIDQQLMAGSVGSAGADTVPARVVSSTTEYAVDRFAWRDGGQGSLHKARDDSFGGREIVVKFLKDLGQRQQFKQEAEITAKLDHPGIVAVYAQGSDRDSAFGQEGCPFYSMRLVHGQPLEERISAFHNRQPAKTGWRRMPLERDQRFVALLENLISACHTVAYAHDVGVIHCDLKPKNIMCGRFGATVVLDWGSAHTFLLPATGKHDSTNPLDLPTDTTGSYTLEYASPEQLHDERRLSPASDVYSLGASLYHMITGAPPFDNRRQEQSKVERPRQRHPRVSRRLDAICMKAMAPDVSERYPSASDLALDLQNLLRDEQITAVPDTLLDRGFRVARRHKLATLLILLTVAMVTVFGMLLGWARMEKHRISMSMDSALLLIEKTCQPLANDETENLQEFKRIANDVYDFTDKYIAENSAVSDSKLAKVFKIRATVRYFYFNNFKDVEATPFAEVGNKWALLSDALADLQQSEELYVAPEDLGACYLTQARMMYWLARDKQSSDNGGSQAEELKRQTYDKIAQALTTLQSLTDAASRRRLAEAFHLRGEFVSQFKGDQNWSGTPIDTTTAQANLEFAKSSYLQSIGIRQDLFQSDQSNKDFARDLARGFGYLGDIQRDMREFPDAVSSYEKSLELRKKNDNRFQLARGMSNFGWLVRDFGKELPAGALQLGSTGDQPLPIVAIEQFILPAMDIQQMLVNTISDQRHVNDLVGTFNMAGELYLFAAMDDPQNQQQYLERAAEMVDRALQLNNSVDDKGTQTRKRNQVVSHMVDLQIHLLRKDAAKALHDGQEIQNQLLGEDFNQLAPEAILAAVVALASQENVSHQKLAELLGLLRQKGFTATPRLENHLRTALQGQALSVEDAMKWYHGESN